MLRRLAKAIEGLDEPAVEKIAEEQQEDPFQVLIATMLSAQTRDPVTASASRRLFSVARTPRRMARLSRAEIQELIYPVSFYRNKAVHVVETCRLLVERFKGRVPRTMEELLTLPGVGRKTANLVLVDFHPHPEEALCDGPQALLMEELPRFLEDVSIAREAYLARLARVARRAGAK